MPPALSRNLPTKRTSSSSVVAERTLDTPGQIESRNTREPHEAKFAVVTARLRSDPVERSSDIPWSSEPLHSKDVDAKDAVPCSLSSFL